MTKELETLWRARCEAMRGVSCYFLGVNHTDLDINREPAPDLRADDFTGPAIAPALVAYWVAAEILTHFIAAKGTVSQADARVIIEAARRGTEAAALMLSDSQENA